MDDDLRTSAAHVLVESLDAGEDLATDPATAHHLTRVLRLRRGEVVTATDGSGRWRRFRWLDDAHLVSDGPIHTVDQPQPPITIGFAPVKGDRPEWAVQKLTELGVDRIVVLRADRSVVRWDGDGHVQRLRRVAKEASMQARRCRLPTVDGPMAPGELGGAMAQFGGGAVALEQPAVMIGPEGGWSDAELSRGFPTVSLGETVLRSETAAVAAGVLLTALRFRR